MKTTKSRGKKVTKLDEETRSKDEEALSRILRFQTEKYEAGKLIELDAPDGVIIHVASGRVLVTTVDPSGQETLCVLRDAGSVIGLESVAGMVLPYFLWTVTDAELSIAPATQARDWLRGNNQATQAFMRASLDALRQSLLEQMALHGSATTRLARLFVNSVEGDSDRKIPAQMMLALPKNVIARMLQMRAETLSRVLRKLEESGGIALSPKMVARDIGKLNEIIESRAGE